MDSRLVTAIVVVVGVPAVAGRLHLRRPSVLVALRPGAPAATRIRPWLWLAPALAVPRPSSWSTRRSRRSSASFQDKTGEPNFVGLDNYVCFFSNSDDARARCATTSSGSCSSPRSRSASGCWSRSSSTGSATSPSPSPSSSCRWRSASSAAGVIWKFMYDYQPPGAAADRHAQRRSSAAFGLGPVRWLPVDTLALEHDRADRRSWCLDLDRLRDGHPLGRAQGHQPGAARGGPGRRRQRVAGLPRDHRSRCSCRRSPSSRRR